MKEIIIFSTGCPRCKVLEGKLQGSGISYKIEENLDEIIEKNFQTVPVMKYNGNYYKFEEAVKLINTGALVINEN